MSDLIIHTTDERFDTDVVNAKGFTLVDFWAPWCGPCRAIAPILDDLAEELKGKLSIVKVDTEDCPNTPARFGIRGIPTLILFKDGEQTAIKVGALSKGHLVAFLKEHGVG